MKEQPLHSQQIMSDQYAFMSLNAPAPSVKKVRPSNGEIARGILKQISEALNIPADAITGKKQTRDICEARQLAMFYTMRKSTWSLTRIGNFFGGRDHATVIHAKRCVNNLREGNNTMSEKYDKLKLIFDKI